MYFFHLLFQLPKPNLKPLPGLDKSDDDEEVPCLNSVCEPYFPVESDSGDDEPTTDEYLDLVAAEVC